MLYYAVLYSTLLYYIILFDLVYYTMPGTILYYQYATLYYNILHYTTLHVLPRHPATSVTGGIVSFMLLASAPYGSWQWKSDTSVVCIILRSRSGRYCCDHTVLVLISTFCWHRFPRLTLTQEEETPVCLLPSPPNY